jgi:hypothetical protein
MIFKLYRIFFYLLRLFDDEIKGFYCVVRCVIGRNGFAFLFTHHISVLPDDLDDVVATLIGEFKNQQPTNVLAVYNVSICQPYEYLAQI